MKEKYIIDEQNYCGECPECKHSWDSGEIPDYLMTLGNTRVDAEILAQKSYGWTLENRKHLSNLIFIEASDGDMDYNGLDGFYQCGGCQIAWNSGTGKRTDKFKMFLDRHIKASKKLKKLLDKNKKKLIITNFFSVVFCFLLLEL